MIRRLLLSHLTLVLLVLAALAIPLGYVFQSSEQQQALRQLEREAEVLASYIDAELDEADTDGAHQIARASAARWRGRVELFDATGRGVFSTGPPEAGVSLMSAQVPVNPGKPGWGTVRVSVPSATLLDQVQQFWALLAVASVAVLAVSVAVAYALATWIGKPVRLLEHATRRLADDTGPAVVPGAAGPPELRRLAETFNRTAARLHSVLEARGSFVEHASHQLKSPLAALRLRLENLEPDVAPAGAANLEAALGETERLDKLVNTLLDLTLIERREETPEPVDLAGEAVERAEIWQPLAAERGVSVHARTPGPVWVSAVSGSVEQILDNLISNALNVAPPGSEITLTAASAADGRIELHVIDAGPGLPAGQREQALEPFWRAPGAPKGGSGLGLALVRKLAEADGGDVRLDPAAPTGIDAVVTFPSSPPPA